MIIIQIYRQPQAVTVTSKPPLEFAKLSTRYKRSQSNTVTRKDWAFCFAAQHEEKTLTPCCVPKHSIFLCR